MQEQKFWVLECVHNVTGVSGYIGEKDGKTVIVCLEGRGWDDHIRQFEDFEEADAFADTLIKERNPITISIVDSLTVGKKLGATVATDSNRMFRVKNRSGWFLHYKPNKYFWNNKQPGCCVWKEEQKENVLAHFRRQYPTMEIEAEFLTDKPDKK